MDQILEKFPLYNLDNIRSPHFTPLPFSKIKIAFLFKIFNIFAKMQKTTKLERKLDIKINISTSKAINSQKYEKLKEVAF